MPKCILEQIGISRRRLDLGRQISAPRAFARMLGFRYQQVTISSRKRWPRSASFFADAADAEIGLYSPFTQSQWIFITSSATIRQSTRRNHSPSSTIVTTNEGSSNWATISPGQRARGQTRCPPDSHEAALKASLLLGRQRSVHAVLCSSFRRRSRCRTSN